MLSYIKCLLCLLVITLCVEIEAERLDLNSVRPHYNYEITNENKVDVKVYYECRCPSCVDFHTTDLNNTYAKIGSYIDLKTYPYGNAHKVEVNGKTEILCQHGTEECHGNKLHACAIDSLNNVSRSLYYISCMMMDYWGTDGSTDTDATKCGQLMNIDSRPIIECANGEKGKNLLEYYGNETDKVKNRMGTPWILINGKLCNFNKGFMTQICEALAYPPPECKQI